MHKTGGRLAIHAFIAGVAVLVTLTVRAGFRERYTVERRRIESAGRDARMHEVAKSWNRHPIVPLDARSITDQFVPALEAAGGGFTYAQKVALERDIPEIMGYLASPTAEAYWRIKTNGVDLPAKPPVLQTLIPARNPAAQPDEVELARQHWDSARTNSGGIPRILGFVPGQIRMKAGRGGTPDELFKSSASLGFTMAVKNVDPGVRYPEPEDAGVNHFAYVGFLAKASTSGDIAPLHVCLRWMEHE